MSRQRDEMTEEISQMWLTNWATLPFDRREKMVKELIRGICDTMPADKLVEWRDKLRSIAGERHGG